MKIYRKKLGFGTVLLLLFIMLVACNTDEPDTTTEVQGENADPVFPVEVNEIQTGVLSSDLTVSGNIMAAKHLPVMPLLSGEVVNVHIENGEKVEKGDVLVELDATDMELNLAQAQAGLDAANASLKSAVNMREQSIKQAEMQLDQARDVYDMIREAEENGESISGSSSGESGQSPADSEEDVEFNMDELTEELQGMMQNLLMSSNMPSEGDKAQAENAVKQAEMALEQAKGTDQIAAAEASVKQAEISVEMAKNQQTHAVVKAPISGQITDFSLVEGELVSPQAPIMQLVQMDEPKVNIAVNETMLPNLELEQRVTVQIPTYNQTYEGEITHIGIMPGEQSRAYPVEVRIIDPEDNLRIGMHAKVLIQSDATAEEVLVPIRAVIEEGEESVVYVTADGESVERRPITIGNESAEFFAVERGLEEGELIIINGIHQLYDGALINVRNGENFNLGE